MDYSLHSDEGHMKNHEITNDRKSPNILHKNLWLFI